MADKVVVETEEQPTPEETGGIVTTVKEEVTKDLDVQEMLDNQEQEEEKPKPAAAKPAAQAKPAAKSENDDEELDFKNLSPEQQAAVGRLYKQQREDRRRLRELSLTVEELKRTKPSSKREEAPVVPKPKATGELVRPVKPRPEDSNSPKEYDAAEQEYEDKLYDYREAVKEAKRQEVEQAKAQETMIKSHNDRQAKFAEAHDDYEDVIDNDLPMSDIMFGAVVEEEVGPALAYHWAKNPDESNKIYAMTPAQQIKAIMRTIVKLEAEQEEAKGEKPKPAAATKPKQPEPPAPVGGRQAVPRDVSKLSFKERERQFAKEHPEHVNYTP